MLSSHELKSKNIEYNETTKSELVAKLEHIGIYTLDKATIHIIDCDTVETID